jgi:uncharacterized spore protein YtfJ
VELFLCVRDPLPSLAWVMIEMYAIRFSEIPTPIQSRELRIGNNRRLCVLRNSAPRFRPDSSRAAVRYQKNHAKEDNGWPTRSSEMSSLAVLQSLKESILSQASVKAIYGEPISANGKTVIPVARIMYGYGAGAGTGGVGDSSARGEGGGGGGGVRAIPVGVIEMSDQQTRFVPITDRKKLTGAVLAGIGFGMWLGWRTRR